MVSEWSSIIPVLKSHFCFSWCVLNMGKHCEGSSKACLSKKGAFGLALEEACSQILMEMSPCTCCFEGQRGPMEAVDHCLAGEGLTGKNKKNQVVCSG